MTKYNLESFLDFNYKRFLKHKKNFVFKFENNCIELESFVNKHPDKSIVIYFYGHLDIFIKNPNVKVVYTLAAIRGQHPDMFISVGYKEKKNYNEILSYLNSSFYCRFISSILRYIYGREFFRF